MLKSVLVFNFLSALLIGQTFSVSTASEFRDALEDASLNHQNDTIVLAAGTYKTTDDSIGTFIFSDDQEYNLTIQAIDGTIGNRVVLDGNNTDTVLNLNNTQSVFFTLKDITITNSPSQSITALKSDNPLRIFDCNISDNHYGAIDAPEVSITNSTIMNNHGNGIRTKNLDMQNTSIVNNTSRGLELLDDGTVVISDSNISYSGYDGIRIGDSVDANISNSQIIYNSGRGITTGYRGILRISDANISNNATTGIYVSMYQTALITGTDINSNTYGVYAFNAAYIALINSLVLGNSETGYSGNATTGTISIVVNSVFANNKLGLKGPGLFVNNLFYNNIENDLNTDIGKTYIFNNYIDYTKIIESTSDFATVLKQNNVQSNEESIVLDNRYTPLSDAVTIDKGLNANSELFIDYVEEFSQNTLLNEFVFDALLTDKSDAKRIINSIVDLGVFELSSTKPNIDNITYSGLAKQFEQLTFSIDYTLGATRGVQEVLYDFEGSYTLENTYTYNTAGPKTVKVKLTDNEGEFTTLTLSLNIAPLAYEEMTFEQKIMHTVDQTHLSDIQEEIGLQTTSSYSQGRVQGEADGIQMCVDSPETYGVELKTKTVIVPMF